MRGIRAASRSLTILGVALLCAVACLLLPEAPYQRWQLLDGTIHKRARWIYERIFFDPTPIDVMIVGPSRVEAGINAPLLGRMLAERGLPANVVNFSLPETGRNINTVIVEEALKTKQPKLIIIGVIEKPSRIGHSAFKYIAPVRDILNPGYIGDIRYFSDLIYLPYRKMILFGGNLLPGASGTSKAFDLAVYPGSSVDTTGDVHLPDGTVKNMTVPASDAELARGVAKLERGMTPPLLPKAFADVEFGDERHNIGRIVELAKAHGARVAFVALPYYTGPNSVQEQSFYMQRGPLWNAEFLSSHKELYADYGHVTADGAKIVTTWLERHVAAELEKSR